MLFYNCQSAFVFIILLDRCNNPVIETEQILGHLFQGDLAVRGEVTSLWRHSRWGCFYRQGELRRQTSLTKLFCLTCGQRTRAGGRDRKGQDAWEVLVLKHLFSSGERGRPLKFLLPQPSPRACGLHPRSSSLTPSRRPLSHLLPSAGSVLPAWSCLTPTIPDSGTRSLQEPLAATGLRCIQGVGTTSKRTEALFPGHRCD